MVSGPKTLRGWKEIATHVGRDVRTVQRWEARRGFPVRRLPGGERGNVYALASEVDEWLHPSNGSLSPLVTDPEPVDEELIPSEPGAQAEEASDTAPRDDMDAGGAESRQRYWRVVVGGVALLAGIAALTTFAYRRHRAVAEVKAAAPMAAPRHYVSPIAGLDAKYLQGMYLFEKRTPDSLVDAQRVLLDVTEKDPQYAAAWSGLAQTLTLMTAYDVARGSDTPAEAQYAAKKALALDPGLAEPHAVLGFADFFWDGNVREAEPEFRRALEVNPASAMAHNWYGIVLTYEGRFPEALEHLNEAQRLEPSSTAVLANRALAFGLSGHREEAVRLLQQAGGDNSIASVRYSLSVLALVEPRDPGLYLREALQLAKESHSDQSVQLLTAAQEAFRRGGQPAMWRSMLAFGEHANLPAETLAQAYAALGENDAALDLLAQGTSHGQRMVALCMSPLFRPLHGNERFRRIVAAQDLPPPS